MKVFGVVYLILNLVNSNRYVGQTVQPLKKRFNSHAKCKKNMPISRAIRKHGKENFYYGVIKSCASKEELDYWEKFYIVALYSKAPYGYNLTDGGEGTVGYVFTDEHRAHLSAALSGEKNHRYGKKNTPEHTAKIVAANLGRKRKPGTGENIAAALRGKPFTKERCAHISAAQRDDSPYKNLIVELDAHNLSYAEFVKLTGIAKISYKMRGIRNFTDADKVKLVEIFCKPIEYLLEHDTTKLDETSSANLANSRYKNLLSEMYARQLSCDALAKLMGLAKSSVYRKMHGERKFTDADKAKLVEIFGKPLEYLLERTEG